MKGNVSHNRAGSGSGSSARKLVLMGVLLLPALGCNALGNRKLVQELQAENERLISEFRAQRDSNTQLRQQNQQLEGRVAESEKLLARNYQGGGARISSLPASGLRSGGFSFPSTQPSIPASRSSGSSAGTGLKWEPR